MFRTKAVEFMLASGHSRTWMISNTIVTITTSGTYIGLDGVCDNCLSLRQKTVNFTHKEKVKVEKSPKQKSTAADGAKEEAASQASSEHASSQISTEGCSKPEKKFVSVDKTALHKTHSVDVAKLKSLSEARRSIASDRRHSEPLVPVNPQNCQCVCQGWAEIFIRRPSGNISWIMRIQNRETTSHLDSDISTAIVDDPQIGECEFVFFYNILASSLTKTKLLFHLEIEGTLNLEKFLGKDLMRRNNMKQLK